MRLINHIFAYSFLGIVFSALANAEGAPSTPTSPNQPRARIEVRPRDCEFNSERMQAKLSEVDLKVNIDGEEIKIGCSGYETNSGKERVFTIEIDGKTLQFDRALLLTEFKKFRQSKGETYTDSVKFETKFMDFLEMLCNSNKEQQKQYVKENREAILQIVNSLKDFVKSQSREQLRAHQEAVDKIYQDNYDHFHPQKPQKSERHEGDDIPPPIRGSHPGA